MHPSYGQTLGQAYGVRTEDKSHDLQLEVGDAEYATLRERAIGYLDRSGRFDDEQLAAMREGSDPWLMSFNPVVDALVAHPDRAGFQAEVGLRTAGPNGVAENLLRLYVVTMHRGPLPGKVQLHDNER